MSAIDLMDPFSDKFHACQDFKKLSPGYMTLTIAAVALAFFLTLGIACVPLFRVMVNTFSKLNTNGDKPNEKTAKKTDEESKKKISSRISHETSKQVERGVASDKQKIVPMKRPAPTTMTGWKEFIRTQLQKQLMEKGFRFEEAVENGDCFYDSIAYLLTGYLGDKQYTAKDIRMAIAKHVKQENQNNDKYKKMLQGNIDGHSWEQFCDNIDKCADEFKPGEGAPIWGSQVTAQIIADIYGIEVRTHSTSMIELNCLMDILGSGLYNNFDYICIQPTIPNVCTLIDTQSTKPQNATPKMVLNIACMDRGPWGHYTPVVPNGVVA